MRQFAFQLCFLAASTFGLAMISVPAAASEFTVKTTDRGVTVYLDGKLFTEYLIKSGKKPILWPIIGPTGKPMTRAYPMDETGAVTKDERDHPHHRSFWFSHGDVNGSDLWTEASGSGWTEHQEFVEATGGKTAKIVTVNDWIGKNGKKLAEDQRTLTFSADGDNRMIDFDITIKATEGELKLGDTKEGTFSIRVPDDFRLTAKKGGRIINSEGVEGKETWGKPAAWVDYQGPVDGETLGIAILNHPSSYGFPTHWHVRDYGLFAANPFGMHDFTGGAAGKGTVTLKPGETLSLRYRVIFHKGDEKKGRIEESFKDYAESGSPKLAPVVGKVSVDGQPLRFGYVQFVPENGRPAVGELDQNGRFELTCFRKGDGATIGTHRVLIVGSENLPSGEIRWHAPKKFAVAETSGLIVQVTERKNEVNFELKSDRGKPLIENDNSVDPSAAKK